MDGSFAQTVCNPEQRIPLHDASLTCVAPNTTHAILASAQDSVSQGQLEQLNDTNADQEPAMDIAQIYRLLARDDGV
ncbi:hypothetical protein P3T76_015643 [Phytophthora citrophthora]|uniref:Uncharacterized protein n=1 Tax=Phytophthora citrophthora TaxID=4793 RepID=A0AAD9LB42_9STRA|nr:hypothetical protein P3T76_015643 [Phytophthora citrophthora]